MDKIAEAKANELAEEDGWINTGIIIEVQGNDEEHTRKSLEDMVERLSKEKGVKIYEADYSDINPLKEDWFSLHVDLKFVAKDFNRLVHVALLYSPSAAEILEPSKEIKLQVGDAQNLMIDIANVVTRLAHTVFAQQGMINKTQKTK